MTPSALGLIAATLFGRGLVSEGLARADLMVLVVFIIVGAALAWAGLGEGPEEHTALRPPRVP